MTRAKRVDNNQAEIVAEFRRLGYKVEDYSDCGKGRPDIMVLYNSPNINYEPRYYVKALVEIKNGNAPYTKAEIAFMERYPGLVTTVRSKEQVKELFG